MSDTSRTGGRFVKGGLLGGVALALALAWHFGRGFWMTSDPGAVVAAAQPQQAPQLPVPQVRNVRVPAAAASATGPSSAFSSSCAFGPMLPRSGQQDGQYAIPPALSRPAKARPDAFTTVAREAAAAGRWRDAEVALIVACRLATQGGASPTVPVADVLRLLGDHYAAAAGVSPGDRDEMVARARRLLQDSVRTYTSVLGAGASRTRLARQRLEALERLDSGALELRQRPVAAPAGEVGATAGADSPASAAGLVQVDPELAQLEEDLGRLRSQAESVAADPSQLRRKVQEARARRDANCRDKACLLRWYARRRSELLQEF